MISSQFHEWDNFKYPQILECEERARWDKVIISPKLELYQLSCRYSYNVRLRNRWPANVRIQQSTICISQVGESSADGPVYRPAPAPSIFEEPCVTYRRITLCSELPDKFDRTGRRDTEDGVRPPRPLDILRPLCWSPTSPTRKPRLSSNAEGPSG